MNTYHYQVVLTVEVPAFDINDAHAAIEDAFGLGETCGATVTKTEVSLTEVE